MLGHGRRRLVTRLASTAVRSGGAVAFIHGGFATERHLATRYAARCVLDVAAFPVLWWLTSDL